MIGRLKWTTVARAVWIAGLFAISIYFCQMIVKQWIDTGRFSSTTFSMENADALGLPSAGMIPAPYANDSNCFLPTPSACKAYFGESSTASSSRVFDCMPWITTVNVSTRTRGQTTFFLLDGGRAAAAGFYFTSILDFVEYTFDFSPLCTQPYLWVFVSGDATLATMDPSDSMRTLAQSSFLIQGGQYVMVAFTLEQEVDLGGNVVNTTQLAASSMMVRDFDPSTAKRATAVFRPASFKIPTNTAVPGQTIVDLIANLGGWIGLFLGFSFVELVKGVAFVANLLKRKPSEQKTEAELETVPKIPLKQHPSAEYQLPSSSPSSSASSVDDVVPFSPMDNSTRVKIASDVDEDI